MARAPRPHPRKKLTVPTCSPTSLTRRRRETPQHLPRRIWKSLPDSFRSTGSVARAWRDRRQTLGSAGKGGSRHGAGHQHAQMEGLDAACRPAARAAAQITSDADASLWLGISEPGASRTPSARRRDQFEGTKIFTSLSPRGRACSSSGAQRRGGPQVRIRRRPPATTRPRSRTTAVSTGHARHDQRRLSKASP